MRVLSLLRIFLPIFVAGSLLAAPANLQVDTKTHVVTATDGSAIMDAKGVTLTVGGFTIYDGAGVKTVVTGSISGAMFGATGNKIGFLGATPVVRQTGNIFTALSAFGLVASPSLTIANTTGLQAALDLKATVAGLALKVDANGSIVSATKTKITYDAKGLVTSGADATTADFADATNKRYVTDAQRTVIQNTSGTNTGDQDLSGLTPKTTTVNGHALTGNITISKGDTGLGNADNTSDANKPVSTAQQTALDLKATVAAVNLKADDSAVVHNTGNEGIAGVKTFTGANIFTPLQSFNSIASSSITTSQLANAPTPTATPIGTHGATTWSYKIVAKLSDGTPSAASPTGSTTIGDDVLDATNKVSLTWAAVTNAASYDVYRTAVGVSPATTGKIANVTTNSYIDAGAAGDSSTAPSTNATGNITLTGPFTGTTSTLSDLFTGTKAIITGNQAASGGNLGLLYLAPTSPSVQGFYATSTLTGSTPPNDWAANEIIVDSDDAAFTNFGSVLNIRHRYGGSALRAGRNTLQVQAYLSGPITHPNSGGGAGNYVSAALAIEANGGGGTDLGSNAASGVFAINPTATLRTGAVNIGELSGGEVNIAAETGSSVKYKNILSLVYNSTDAVSGTLYDCMLALSSQSFNGGKNGILFGGMNGAQPIKNSGNLIATDGSFTVANGIYFPDYIFTNWALYAPHGAANVSSVSTGGVTIANDNFNTLTITGNHSFFTGMHIVNTITGGKDWGIYSGGGLGGPAGSFLIYDNTPSTGGSRFVLSPSGDLTLARGLVGTTTNNNAVTGSVGEYVSSSVASGSAVSCSNGAVINITSISLTAGDWDVTGVISFINGAASTSDVVVGTSPTSATLGSEPTYLEWAPPIPTSQSFGFNVPTSRYSLASTTTVYLVTRATWTGSTITSFGTIRARRMR